MILANSNLLTVGPSEIDKAFAAYAGARTKAERAKVLADTEAIFSRLHAGLTGALPAAVQAHFATLRGAPKAAERNAAIAALTSDFAVSYAKVAEQTAVTDGLLLGGQSGQVAFGKIESGNTRLDGFLEILQQGPPIFRLGPVAGVPAGGDPCRHVVTVAKPGAPSPLGEAGLEPEFLHYLRLQQLSYLRTYAEWRAEEGVDDSAASRRTYDEVLAAGYETFERERNADRYCTAHDLPAPGVHRGSRLLRLPVRLWEDDFRPACGPSRIYEGPFGMAAPPELDYEELVRRYVSQLRTSPVYFYDAALGTQVLAASHQRDITPADALVQRLFVVASVISLGQPAGLRQRLRPMVDSGQLFLTGPSPAEVTSWLRSSGAAGLRTQVINVWRGILQGLQAGPAAAAPSTVPALALPVAEFESRVRALLEPFRWGQNTPPIAGGFFQQLFQDQEADPGTRTLEALEKLAAAYNEVWLAARNLLGAVALWDLRNDLKFSGYEARACILILGAFVPRTFAIAGRSSQAAQALHAKIRLAGDDVWNRIQQESLQITPEELIGYVPPFGQPAAPPSSGGTIDAQKQTDARDALVQSYRYVHDLVLSLLPTAAAAAVAPAAGAVPAPGVAEADLPGLYDRWIFSFSRILDEQVQLRNLVGTNLLVLRLTRRDGKYRETPQRQAAAELINEPTEQISPEHPTRRTRAYVLEPVPARYYRTHHPAVYLREDYAVALRHKAYGIGQNIYSMSLLPDEKQTIVMKSFKNTTTKVSESTAENIFEEAGSETANDFASEVAAENQRESNNSDNFQVSGKVSDGIPFVDISIETGYSAQSSVKDFAKNTNNVTNRLASKFSAKKTVTLETKRAKEVTEELHTELNTEREIKNPNLGHTVTFHWFQMTRKVSEEISLEDVKFVYTAGKHNPIRVFKKGLAPPLQKLPASLPQETIAEMPADLAHRFPPDAAIVIVAEPYTEVVSMSAANAFLARLFSRPKAVEISSVVWQIIGYGRAAPEGLGIAAFPRFGAGEPTATDYTPLFSTQPAQSTNGNNRAHVAADEVTVRRAGFPGVDRFFLPNIDLRFQEREGVVPSRFSAPPHHLYALPRVISMSGHVLNTNGVYCDAMVGHCSALETYLQQSRDLDLLEKRIQVAQQEIELLWNLAKNNLVSIVEGEDHSLVALVKEKDGEIAFRERLDVERRRLAEQESIATAELEKQRLEKELELKQEQINELKQRIALLGVPPEVRIDAPDGANVAVNAKVNLGGPEPSRGGSVTIE